MLCPSDPGEGGSAVAGVYNAASLEQVVRLLEERYELSSPDFHVRLAAGTLPAEIPFFHRHIWASFSRDIRRMRGDGFAERAERVLALT